MPVIEYQDSFEDRDISDWCTSQGTFTFPSDITPPPGGGTYCLETKCDGPWPDSAKCATPTFALGKRNPGNVYVYAYLDAYAGDAAVQIFHICRQINTSGGATCLPYPNHKVGSLDVHEGLTTPGLLNIRVYHGGGWTTLLTNQAQKVWYKLEFLKINYVTHTFDIAINDVIRASGLAFKDNVDEIQHVSLESRDYATGRNRPLFDLVTTLEVIPPMGGGMNPALLEVMSP